MGRGRQRVRRSGQRLWYQPSRPLAVVCHRGDRSAAEAGIEIGPQSPLAGPSRRLAAEMTGHERVAFCNTGSEAVTAAIRMARTVTGRDKIVMFSGSYHGTFDEVLVARRRPSRGEARSMPIAPGIVASACENILVLDYGSPSALELLRAHGAELAAVLVEPVQSRRPELPADQVPAGRAADHARQRHGAGFRRGRHRLSRAPWRRAGAVRDQAGPRDVWKSRRRRACPSDSSPATRVSGHPRRRSLGVRRLVVSGSRHDLLRGDVRAPSAGPCRGAGRCSATSRRKVPNCSAG